ncbi:MAG TPA: glycoside hydrolase family 43 protein [Acidimicrobiales bacterium]|nr:glycoside hydrolase family 43 protein [Acidimicrobiales bacterium]
MLVAAGLLVTALVATRGPVGTGAAGGSTGPTLERAEVRRRPVVAHEPIDREAVAVPAAAGRAVPAASSDADLAALFAALAAAAPADGAPPPASPGPEVERPPPRPDRAAPPAAPGSAPPVVSEGSEAVHRDDFPDPYVMQANGSWWAFSTQVGVTAIPTLRSDDLVHWEWVGDALQAAPAWAEWGHHWAPSVLRRGSTFVMYYTTRDRATGLQCTSRAVSLLPQGPYVDRTDGPMICQTRRGGSIDPSPFVDADGRAYLLWKSEGTLRGEPTRIWGQRLSGDGQRLLGERRELLHRALDWEFPIIEGPTMALVGGRHHLLYSGNRWESADYAVGHAVCDSVLGPCRRTSALPILSTRRGAAGPGGQELLAMPDGGLALVHHAWDPAAVGYPHGARMLHVATVHVEGDRMAIGGPWGRRASSGLLDLGG